MHNNDGYGFVYAGSKGKGERVECIHHIHLTTGYTFHVPSICRYSHTMLSYPVFLSCIVPLSMQRCCYVWIVIHVVYFSMVNTRIETVT